MTKPSDKTKNSANAESLLIFSVEIYKHSKFCLFALIDAFYMSLSVSKVFGHVGRVSCLPGLNQY